MRSEICIQPGRMDDELRKLTSTSTRYAAALVAGMLACSAPLPVLSQGVQLVVVDVHAVADGYRTSKLIGRPVVNDQNEKIGTIEDIIIGRDRVLFAVLQVGGFLQVVCVKFSKLVMVRARWFFQVTRAASLCSIGNDHPFVPTCLPAERRAQRQSRMPSRKRRHRRSRRAASLTERARCEAEPVGGQAARRNASFLCSRRSSMLR
jgi:PRC-barrel domain